MTPFHRFDPSEPTDFRHGTEEKVALLEARYAAALPLWHPEDISCLGRHPALDFPGFLDQEDDDFGDGVLDDAE